MHRAPDDFEASLLQIKSIGLHVADSPFDKKEFVGNLLFKEFPTTSVYADDQDNVYIKEWIDCSDDGKIDRYYFFQISAQDLSSFINGNLSHKEFVFSALNNAYHFIDIVDDILLNSVLVFKNKFPEKYTPRDVYKFNHKDGVDTDDIKTRFKLSAFDKNISSIAFDAANKASSETFNLHLEEGIGVGFGIANTEILGNSLLRFNSLYEEATYDHFLGSERDHVNASRKKQLKPYASTEVFMMAAASFSLMIRPSASRYNLFDDRSSSEIVAGHIFSLFEKAKNVDTLAESFGNYSPLLIESFKNFLKGIQSTKVKVGFSWYNPTSQIAFAEELDYKNSHNILSNLESLSTTKNEVIKKKGFFEVLHCNTAYFGFVSLDNIYFTGYLDPKIRDRVRSINFTDEYEVVFSQKTHSISGRSEVKIENKIIDFNRMEIRQSKELI